MKKCFSLVLSLIMLFTTLAGAGTTAFAKSANTNTISKNIIISKWHICTLVEYKQPTCTQNGYKKYKCRFCKYTTKTSIAKSGHTYEDYIVKATPDSDGEAGRKCTVCNNKTNRVVISSPREIKPSANNFIYTGSEIKPGVQVYDSNGKCIDSTEYTVKYSDNISVGTAKITVLFSSKKYEGKLEAKFTISKAAASGNTGITLKNAKPKGFTVKFSVKPSVKKYQLQYSLGPTFQASSTKTITKTVNVSGAGTVSYTVTNLQPLKTYYVRVRLYNSGIGYGGWSTLRTIKIFNY